MSEEPPASAASSAEAMSSEAATETPPPAAADKFRGKLANCPSAVKGAKTTSQTIIAKSSNGPGYVSVSVIAEDEVAIKAIRAKAAHLSKAPDGTAVHNGKRANTAEGGRCPTSIAGTTTEVTEVDGGVAIHIKPGANQKLDELKKIVTTRTEQLMNGVGVHQHGSKKGGGMGGGDKAAAGKGDGLGTTKAGTKAGPMTGGGKGDAAGGGKPQ